MFINELYKTFINLLDHWEELLKVSGKNTKLEVMNEICEMKLIMQRALRLEVLEKEKVLNEKS